MRQDFSLYFQPSLSSKYVMRILIGNLIGDHKSEISPTPWDYQGLSFNGMPHPLADLHILVHISAAIEPDMSLSGMTTAHSRCLVAMSTLCSISSVAVFNNYAN